MPKLYLILSTHLAPLSQLEVIAHKAIKGGIDWIQFRHKEPYTEEVLSIAKKIRFLCREHGIPFILNDRFDLALHLDADGVHIGQTDIPLSIVRSFLPKGKILGATTPTLEAIEEALYGGANYACIGHIFPTSTKEKTTPPLGIEKLVDIATCSPLPLFAIGGIDDENVASVLSAPITGIAVSAAICSAPDPEKAAKMIKQRMQNVYSR
jgi:thiamine-phosphate pyrophosphorylase